MSTGAVPPGLCSRCGATNPFGSTSCAYCGTSLLSPPIAQAPFRTTGEDSFRLVTSEGPAPQAKRFISLYLGIMLVLVGIGLLAMSAVVSQGVQNFNQACSQNPLCHPESDPSGGIAAGGVVLLILGIGLAAYGYSQYARQT